MRGIDARDVDSAFAEWSSRLERCTAEPVPARRLYAGDHWSVVQSLEDVAAASKLDPAIWVCSAGYGLIGIDTNIKPYSATFSSRHLDTVCRWNRHSDSGPNDGRSWWECQQAWSGPEPSMPRSIAEIAALDSRSPVLIVASRGYMRAIVGDVQRATRLLTDPDLLSIISTGTGKGAADEPVVRGLIRELAQLRPRSGSPRLSALVRRELGAVNHKRVERIYAQEGLQLPRRRKGRRRGAGRAVPLAALTGPNQRWPMDFVQDSTVGGRRIRALAIVDQFTRECPAIEVDTSITGQRVVRVLDRLRETHGLPQALVLDNGPEFTSKALAAWAKDSGVRLHFIAPGRPTENGYIESFNGKFRDECLDRHWFQDLADSRVTIEDRRTDYNRDRPHSSLGYLTPLEFKQNMDRNLSLTVV